MSTHALTSHHLAEVSAIETDGLWCIGVGALVVALSALVGGHLGGIASRPFTALGLRKDRLMYAGTVAGGVLVASGSLIVAGEHVPAVWMVIATAVWVVGAFWLLAAWRLRVGSTEDGKNLTREYPTQAPGLRWDIQKAELQMQWRWALRHAFSSDASNSADAERRLGRRPKTKDADQEPGEEEPSQEPGEKDPSQLPGEDDASRQLIASTCQEHVRRGPRCCSRVELHRDAFLIDDGPQSSVDLAAHRGESSLEALDIGEQDADAA